MQPEADDVSFHLTCSQLLFIFLVFSLRLFTFHYFFAPFFFYLLFLLLLLLLLLLFIYPLLPFFFFFPFFAFFFLFIRVCVTRCHVSHAAIATSRRNIAHRVLLAFFQKIYKAAMNGHYFNPHYQLMFSLTTEAVRSSDF